MARSTMETTGPAKRESSNDNSSLTPAKKRVAIAAVTALVLSLGFVSWYFLSAEPEYQEVKGAPPETTLLTITNTTALSAAVKVKAAGEATAPTGFKGDSGGVVSPLEVNLDAHQGDQFVFSDGAAKEIDAPIEIEIEANVGGTILKGTFTFPHKKRVYINFYDAAGPVSFDIGPGVTMK